MRHEPVINVPRARSITDLHRSCDPVKSMPKSVMKDFRRSTSHKDATPLRAQRRSACQVSPATWDRAKTIRNLLPSRGLVPDA